MIKISNILNGGTLTTIKVDKKSDIDTLTSDFDCYTNPAIPDEAILDTATVRECPELTSRACETFGEAVWEEIPSGLVIFHG